MITKMKKYTFLVFHRDYDAFLNAIREAGVVHVAERGAGAPQDEALAQLLAEADELRRVLRQGAPDQLLQERSEVEKKLAAVQREKERAAVWGPFSKERIAALQQAGHCLRFYSCPKAKFKSEWGIHVAEQGGRIWFVTLDAEAPADMCEEQQVEKSAADWQKDEDALNGLLAAANARIEAWQLANLTAMQEQLHDLQQRIDWKRVTLNTDSLAEGSLRLVEGFCPVDNTEMLNAVLAGQQVYYTVEDPTPEDKTPIKLHNNRFTRMFECLTGMYGWPDYGEFDPTPILGPFFLLFFALCIGDAGYGILLTIIGVLIHKGKLKIDMFEGLGPIITALGVGSTVVGYLMGGFFGIDLYSAEWFPEWGKTVMFKQLGDADGKIAGYDVMMIFSLVIGVFHICLAMVVKAVGYTRRFGWKENISLWGWLLLILGSLVTGVLAMMNVLSEEATKVTLITIGAVSALGIFIFNKPGRNPLINIGAGLWDTYGMATGIMGDVLSYIRLYALGLAGGMLGMAFNQLGAMVLGEEPGIGAWIGFLLIVTFGHVLNLLMACLGAFVHPLRLTFVEYFKNSGYEGSGKLYEPFRK